jgi:repressor of nif and glnA expression
MEHRTLKDDEADKLILQLLKEAGRPLSTREVQEETQKRLVRCPDSTVVFLNKLRIRGLVHGEMNKEKRGWVWWV